MNYHNFSLPLTAKQWELISLNLGDSRKRKIKLQYFNCLHIASKLEIFLARILDFSVRFCNTRTKFSFIITQLVLFCKKKKCLCHFKWNATDGSAICLRGISVLEGKQASAPDINLPSEVSFQVRCGCQESYSLFGLSSLTESEEKIWWLPLKILRNNGK